MIQPVAQQQWSILLRSLPRLKSSATYSRPTRRLIKTRRLQHTLAEESRLPRIAQPSTWQLVIPRFLRPNTPSTSKPTTKKPINPATFFIWIYLLIGSQAIRIIGIQNEFKTFTRRADLQLAKLREVVERLQRGEDVDVEKILGTGIESEETEWERALKELESEDRIWQNNRKKQRDDDERQAREDQDANPVNDSVDKVSPSAITENVVSPQTSMPRPPAFY